MAKRQSTASPSSLVNTGLSLPADELGTYIFAANPYAAGLPPSGTWPGPGSQIQFPPSVVRLVDDPDDADPRYMLCASDAEMQENPGNWKFKYGDLYVRRAVRIPYMYYKVSDADSNVGMLVNDYFLIGFEGGGSY